MTGWQQEAAVEAVTVAESGKALMEWGQIQLILLDGADEKVDLIVSHWQNEVNDEGDLVFPIPIKGVLDLTNGVATAWRPSSTTTAGRPEFLWTPRRRTSVSRGWQVQR
ncbi:hypothetical protein [Arthrobacter glacialis]|uniref:Uncharacterized protein n=1 Tax=Arthrobacter glacialis TaxID=1664 RepID=A0A2S3ZRA1_ARTGL|nr:hypothetical protein [Arthrobacter glacialis]POH71765.1 hypothetical protein CVS27_19310 [Arthrobacter glacialis]